MEAVSPASDAEAINIHSAIKRNDDVQIKKYIARGDLEARDKDALTPLHVASAGGSATIVECLIKKGARVDPVSKIGHTPLHLACRFGHLPVVLLLLANHAELNSRDKDENTPLHKAASNGKSLLCRELVKRGADIDARNDTAYTPLHWACFKGHKGAAEQLLKCGANINATSSRQATALFMSAYYGHVDVTLMLLAWGADSSISNEEGVAPGDHFFSEVSPGHKEQIRRLFADGRAILMKGYEATRRNMALMYMRSERSDLHLQHSQGEMEVLWDKLAKREKELNISKVGARDLSHAVKAMKTALEKAREESKSLKAKIAALQAIQRRACGCDKHEVDKHEVNKHEVDKHEVDKHEVVVRGQRGRTREIEAQGEAKREAFQDFGPAEVRQREVAPQRRRRSSSVHCDGANVPLKRQSSGEYIAGAAAVGTGFAGLSVAKDSPLPRRAMSRSPYRRSASFSGSENGPFEDTRDSPRRWRESPRRAPLPTGLPSSRNSGEGSPPARVGGRSAAPAGIRGGSHMGRSARSRSPSPVPVPVPAGNVAAHASAINTRVAELGRNVVPMPPVKASSLGEAGGSSGINRAGSWSSLLYGVSGPMVIGSGVTSRAGGRGSLPVVPPEGGRGSGIMNHRNAIPCPLSSENSRYVRSNSSASASSVLMRSDDEGERSDGRQREPGSTNGVGAVANANARPGEGGSYANAGYQVGEYCLGDPPNPSDSDGGARESRGIRVTGIRGRVGAPAPPRRDTGESLSSTVAASVARLVDIARKTRDSASDSGEETVPISPESFSRDQE